MPFLFILIACGSAEIDKPAPPPVWPLENILDGPAEPKAASAATEPPAAVEDPTTAEEEADGQPEPAPEGQATEEVEGSGGTDDEPTEAPATATDEAPEQPTPEPGAESP